jgi:thiol-disulfide isomerase/thioredoxin
MPESTTTRPTTGRTRLWAIGLALVVALGIVAVVATRGGDDAATPAGTEQTRPVTVEGIALPPAPSQGADPAVGEAFPELVGSSFDGEPVEITDDGTPKVVLFLAHWCPHCQREVPAVQDWLDDNGPPEGVDLYSVATATGAQPGNFPPSAWLADEGWTVPVLADDADGSAATAVGLSGFPFFVAVDGDGTVVARASGEIGAEGLEQLIALAGGTA